VPNVLETVTLGIKGQNTVKHFLAELHFQWN